MYFQLCDVGYVNVANIIAFGTDVTDGITEWIDYTTAIYVEWCNDTKCAYFSVIWSTTSWHAKLI
jgi:hypothetical protein